MLVVMPKFIDDNYEKYAFSIKFAQLLITLKVFHICLKTFELKRV